MLYILKNGEDYNNEKAKAEDVGVKAVDDNTLVVTLASPAAYFIGLTAFHAYYPVRQDIVEANPDTWASNAKTIIGNGPDALTRVTLIGNDLKLDSGVGTCGKEGQSVPVGVGQPTLRIDGLTVGGTA